VKCKGFYGVVDNGSVELLRVLSSFSAFPLGKSVASVEANLSIDCLI
jgi:hypothetical protein